MLRLTLFKLSSLLFLLYANSVYALDVLIYHNNYSDTYTNVKAQMEADGHTVTGSTSTTVASNLINSYDVVVDLLYNNNCGSTCRGNYDDFVKNGGTLIITGENESYFSSRNSNIENLITNKFGGTLTVGNASGTVNSFNSTYTENTNTYTLAGGGSLSGDGVWVAKVGTTVVWMTWQGDDLPSGYTGAVYVTADINQFQNQYGGSAAKALYSDLVAYSGSSSSSSSSSPTPVYSSGITTAQSTKRSSKLSETNAQGGMIANIGITGGSNIVDVYQADAEHYLELSIVGNTNAVDIDQTQPTGTAPHYADVVIDGNRNTLDLLQTGTGSKTAFVDVDGDDNVVDVIQKDSGQHYLQLDLIGDDHSATIVQEGSGSHDATVELTNGGGAWDFNLNQKGTTDKEYSLPHSMSDGSTTSGTCYVAAGCSATIIQSD